jgi:predicted nucleic acid-binding protein
VVNASPLILLGKVDQLRLLQVLTDELIIPAGVAQEVRVKPDGNRALEALVGSPTVRIETGDLIPRDIKVWDLGRGESEVLAWALTLKGCRVVIDDLEARRCAETLGIGVIGTLGIVLRAKRIGLISAARPVVDQLRSVGLYVSDDLVERALAHLGESPVGTEL